MANRGSAAPTKPTVIKVHDIPALANELPAIGRGQKLTGFNDCAVGVTRFSTHSLWERHPAGDELLQVFEGELDLTVLTDYGPVEVTLRPGTVFVVPRGLWHSPRPRGTVSLLFVGNPEGSEVSDKRDPRII